MNMTPIQRAEKAWEYTYQQCKDPAVADAAYEAALKYWAKQTSK